MRAPWMFKKINHFLKTGTKLPDPSIDEIKDICVEHARRLVDWKGEEVAIKEMRSLASQYVHGIIGNAEFKKKIFKATTFKEFNNIWETYAKEQR